MGRREFLGGVASLVAAAAYTQNVPERVAAQVTNDADGDTQTVASPDGRVGVTVDVSGGTPTYSVAYDGTTYVDASALGFDFQNQPTFGAGATESTAITVTGSESGTATESWNPVWGQYDSVSQEYSYLRLGLEETADPGRSGNLEFRVFDDGIGFRFVFDTDFASNGDLAVVASENTEFNFAGDYTAWWIRNEVANPRFEQEYQQTPLSEIDAGTKTTRPTDTEMRRGAHTPLTVRTGDGVYLSVHESDLDDYAAATLAPSSDSGGTTLATELTPLPDGTRASLSLPNATPWRTIQIGTRPGDLVESELIPLLASDRDDDALPTDSNGDVDTSWITTRKYTGIWWTMIAGNANWEYKTDTQIENDGETPAEYIHGARTERMKRYMQFSAENGMDSVLVEGWNKGWDTYPGDGSGFEFGVAGSYPDFDVPAVTSFGRNLASSVGMTIHNETAGNVPQYEDAISNGIFGEYEAEGIHSIKNGYVSDPGLGIDGDGASPTHNQHNQLAVNHHRFTIRNAAGNRQLLEIHEGIKPTGEIRTYPNVANREVVKAQEYDGFGALGSNVGRDHHVTLPFTRMLAGPTSYQPGIFDITFNDSEGDQIQTTLAKQLAMYPNYLSGLQMAADRIEAYVDSTLGVGEYVQAPSGDLGGFITADKWRDAFGTNYVPVDPNRVDAGSTVTVTVENVPSAGTYDLHFRYASDGTDNADRVLNNGNPEATLVVNGTEQPLAPSFTNNWDDWQIHTVAVDLQEGTNTVGVRLNYDDSDGFTGDVGGFNLNTVGVTEAGAGAPFPANYTDLTDAQVANENVDSVPEFSFIEDVPTDWDETRVLDSAIGEYVVTARRKGEAWYVGAMTDEGGRALDVALDFLSPQSNGWKMEMYTDAATISVDDRPTETNITESIVAAGDEVLVSMADSGGTAIRLTPATSAESSDLPSYAKPTQSGISFSFDGNAGLNQQFISVTGTNNSTRFVGGKTYELVVNGAVERTTNVRLPPTNAEATYDLSYVVTVPGIYSVEVRDPVDDTVVASDSLEIIPGEEIAAFSDPTGDDAGPGGYTYPTNSAFRDGAFDIEAFSVYESADQYLFSFDVGNLYDAFGGDFSPHYFVVYLRDPTRSDGAVTENGDLGLNADFGSAWQYRLSASGFSSDLRTANGDSVGSVDKLVSLENDLVLLAVDKSDIDVDIVNAEVAPVVGSEDFGSFRDVTVDGGEYVFGGADPDAVENAPRIIDMLTPPGESQSDLLAYGENSSATVAFTPLYKGRFGTDTERVASLGDGTGDPYGPAESADGTNAFSYDGSGHSADDYEIERLDVYQDGSDYRFLLQFSELRDPFGGDYGYSLQHVQIYIHDPTAEGGNTYAREGVHASGAAENVFAKNYHRRVVAHGFASDNSVSSGTVPVVEDGNWNVVDDATGGVSTRGIPELDAIEITVPQSAIGARIRDVEIVPLVFGYDGFGTASVRGVDVGSSGGDYGIGGGQADSTGTALHNNILDVIVPSDVSQATVLDPTASDITDTDDFAGYDIPFVSEFANDIRRAVAGDGPVTSRHFQQVKAAYQTNSPVPGTDGLVPDYADLRDIAEEVGR